VLHWEKSQVEEVRLQVRVGIWVIAFWAMLAVAVMASIAHAIIG